MSFMFEESFNLAETTCLLSSSSLIPITAFNIASAVPRLNIFFIFLILSLSSWSDSGSLPVTNAFGFVTDAPENGEAEKLTIVLTPVLYIAPDVSATIGTFSIVSSPEAKRASADV